MPRTTANNSGPQPSRRPQQDRINLLLDAAGKAGLTAFELHAAAPDVFTRFASASSLMSDMFTARRAGRTKQKVLCPASGTVMYRYWHLRHCPKEYLPPARYATQVDVQDVPQVATVTPIRPVIEAPTPRVSVRVHQYIGLTINGQEVPVTEQEARAILNTLLTIFPDARKI